MTLTKALSLSLNTVAVRIGLEGRAEDGLRDSPPFGHHLRAQRNAIALGTSAATPLQMALPTAAFANGGIGVQPHVIARVRTANGSRRRTRSATPIRAGAIDPQYVAMMNEMMKTPLTGTARRAELPGRQAARETGTSQDFRDAGSSATRAISSRRCGSATMTTARPRRLPVVLSVEDPGADL